MIVTEEKPLSEVLEAIADDEKVFIVGCAGCPEGWETGGPAKVAELAEKLRANGKDVVGTVMIDFLCNKALVGLRLARCLDALKAADALLVVSCGVGVQATAAIRAALKLQGRPIGAYDALIAGTGVARGLIVVTSNVGEFNRVSGLQVENWR